MSDADSPVTFAERVAAASAAWVFIPDGADHALTDEYSMVAYPTSWRMPTQAISIRSDRQPDAILDDLLAVARSWNRPELAVWVDPLTSPSSLEASLLHRGGQLAETVSVLAFDLTREWPSFDLADDITTLATDSISRLRDSETVNAVVWEAPSSDDAELAAQLEERNAGYQRVVAYAQDTPIASGGLSIEGDVLKLWAGATLPQWRGRGAYRALLDHRMRIGRETGATLALVKGRIETSAPILQRLGFSAYGEERAYVLPV